MNHGLEDGRLFAQATNLCAFIVIVVFCLHLLSFEHVRRVIFLLEVVHLFNLFFKSPTEMLKTNRVFREPSIVCCVPVLIVKRIDSPELWTKIGKAILNVTVVNNRIPVNIRSIQGKNIKLLR